MFSWYARGFYQQSRKGTDSNIVDVSDTIISLVSIQKKWKWPVILQHLPENDVYKGCCKMSLSFILLDYDRSFAASHSCGTKPPYWRAKVTLGQDKQRKLPFKIMYVFCLSCPSATFAVQRGGFAPREWLDAKGLLLCFGSEAYNNSMAECDLSSTVYS